MRQTDLYHVGRDDPIVWELGTDDGPLPPTFYLGIVRVQLRIGETVVDSARTPDAFDWSKGDLRIRLNRGPALEPGWHETRLIVYTQANPDGIERWTDLPWIRVVATAA